MSKEFLACVAAGGRVRTITPKKGHFMHVCFPKGGGPSVAGEVVQKKKEKPNEK